MSCEQKGCICVCHVMLLAFTALSEVIYLWFDCIIGHFTETERMRLFPIKTFTIVVDPVFINHGLWDFELFCYCEEGNCR